MSQMVSASRRTDMPAFHMPWLLSRMDAGFVCVSNPLNPAQTRSISLMPQDVDGFIFWSKNPAELFRYRQRFADYAYYIQYTLNLYGERIEPRVPVLNQRIETFINWAAEVGPHRVLWRYDPIFLCSELPTEEAHISEFSRIADALYGHTTRCTISFLEPYRKIASRVRESGIAELAHERRVPLASRLLEIASQRGIQLCACAMDIPGIVPARCVDADLMRQIMGSPISRRKSSGQRAFCSCHHSADIGSYNTCPHGCVYCYANANEKSDR